MEVVLRKRAPGLLRKKAAYQWKLIKKHRAQYLFVLPYLLIFLTFTMIPVIVSMVISFTSFNILEPPRFIGIQNYFRLFVGDKIFVQSIKNTIVFAVVTGPVGYMISLLIAWVINDHPRHERVFFTVLFYAPSLTGGLTAIMKILFSSDRYGFLNAILLSLGLLTEPVLFLEDLRFINGIIIFVILWGSMGTQFLSFIAGLQGIDRQYYEAGAMDGITNRWQELWFITLPLMKPQLMFGAVLSITGSLGVGSIITGLVGFPSKEYAAHTIMLHLSDYGGVRYEMGYASAIATVLFLIMIFCNKGIQKLLSKVGA
ncbi:ABC transporter permease [Spirochaetia bacterium]|nr:ABC transporter permease [Spirochaetia bacterium]